MVTLNRNTLLAFAVALALVTALATFALMSLLWGRMPGAMMSAGMTGPGAMTSGGSNAGMMGMGDVDRRFIEQMIPHHQDAVDMADLALQKAQRPEVKQLAGDIKRAQTSEIEQMRAWYKSWYGADVPVAGGNSGNRGMMGPGGMSMNMSMNMDIEALANAADFDKTFIEMMVPHHQMAVMMANMVVMNGSRPELNELGNSIITSQTAEIEQMRTWHQEWYGTRMP